MKTRSGFVSNSSSTSFTCCICSEEVSGMDMGIREAGMCKCRNGHTFCEGHQLESKELTIEEKRKVLITRWENAPLSNWMTPERKLENIQEEKNRSDDEVEDYYRDFVSNEKVDPSYCPVCQFKKFIPDDLFVYLTKKLDITPESILSEVEDKFETYENFKKFLAAKE